MSGFIFLQIIQQTSSMSCCSDSKEEKLYHHPSPTDCNLTFADREECLKCQINMTCIHCVKKKCQENLKNHKHLVFKALSGFCRAD